MRKIKQFFKDFMLGIKIAEENRHKCQWGKL